jgi:parallel beta-helix repeat protein
MTDAREHGAVGDGRTDDTQAIQGAIDAAPPGGEVQIPAGEYLVGTLTVRTDRLRLRGDGRRSVLRFRGDGEKLLSCDANGLSVESMRLEDGGKSVMLIAQNVRGGADDPDEGPSIGRRLYDGFTARDLELVCTNGASRGIIISDTHRALVEGCLISQEGQAREKQHDGIRIHSARATTVMGCTVRGNTVRGAFFRSIQSRGRGARQDLGIEGNQVSGSVGCGIWAYHGAGLTITDNTVSDSAGDGIFFDPTTSRQGQGLCANNRVERCARFGIMTEEAKNASEIRQNTISACGTGILVGGGCRGLSVNANTIADSREAGILLDRFGGTPNQLQIADVALIGNVIQRSGTAGIVAKGVRRGLMIDQNNVDGSGSLAAGGSGVVVEQAPRDRRRGGLLGALFGGRWR